MTLRRAFEVVVASIGLCLMLPILAVTGALVWFNLGRPILFSQLRSGLGGRPFVLVKFRSMAGATDVRRELLTDAQRLTRFGRWLRRSRLDEVPQLINVLRGEMSIVGPRPLLPATIAAAGAAGWIRGQVRPGLTGWAQVNGNALLSDREKLSLDLWYVAHAGLLLDIAIVLRTLGVVVLGERRDEMALRRSSCEL